jgi:DNA-binding response OmpR family regulator
MIEPNTPTKPLALIIEDDHQLANIFARALEMAEFDTEIIQDGQLALQRLTAIIPTVIVLDLHLPNIPGQQILEQVRSDPNFNDTRIMITTADPGLADSLSKEVDLVLIKPVSFIQLRDLAARLRPPDVLG